MTEPTVAEALTRLEADAHNLDLGADALERAGQPADLLRDEAAAARGIADYLRGS